MGCRVLSLLRVVGVEILLYGKFGLARFDTFGYILFGVLHLFASEYATLQEIYNLLVVVVHWRQGEDVVAVVCRVEVVCCPLLVKLVGNIVRAVESYSQDSSFAIWNIAVGIAVK